MSKRPHLTLVVSNPVSCADGGTRRGQKSFERVLDAYQLRVDLPDRWQRYVTTRFGDYNLVAAFFDVTGQTAINWREGLHRPSADKLLMVALADPEGFETYFRAPYLGDRAAA